MPTGKPEPVMLEKNGKQIHFPSIRSAWLKKLRGPHDSCDKIGERNRKKVRAAIENHTQINGYYIYYDCYKRRIIMDDILKIKIHQMQDAIKQIMINHDFDIVSLGNYITEALKDAKCNYTFKLIKLEEK